MDFTGGKPTWSADGRSVLLPSAFVSAENPQWRGPCIAVVRLRLRSASCVEPLKGFTEQGLDLNYHYVDVVGFEGPGANRIFTHYVNGDGTQARDVYTLGGSDKWMIDSSHVGAPIPARPRVDVSVKQGLNDPPTLVATDSETEISRVVWDPNPQLREIELGEARVYRWKDVTGRDWKAGLFLPVPYEPERHYPLVIQTHGFLETEFRPSGIFPTAFAARALANAGILVLQVDDCPLHATPDEAPCNVRGYEAAVSELVGYGLVDPERIGMVGFSRTCLYVMEALTTGAVRVQAASITDGVMEGYLQYMSGVDSYSNGLAREYDAMLGGRPFGKGLEYWLRNSPLFNMNNVSAALLVTAEGPSDLPFMWEPYAAMRYLNKPVDLVILNTDEHVLSNPAARIASQGGTVDWFRFWLQGYEDPDSAKAAQYRRWESLCDLQVAQNSNQAAFCVRSKTH